ncbi:MAG: glycerophosphoryl diester phosphodiesterase [Oceanospirillaceae bacterium]|jgi:glycerophosphoryl diester phosphodiesterase
MFNLKIRLALLSIVVLLIVSCAERTKEGSKVLTDNHSNTLVMTLVNERSQNVMVAAHRACWRLAPENSIEAIEKCIQLGVDMVEIDVRRTRDGHLIILHDETLNRTTNGVGLVSERTLAEVSELQLKEHQGGDGIALTEYHIPTLEEALRAGKGKILINLDAKDEVRDQAYALTESLGMTDQIVIKKVINSPDEVQRVQNMAFFGKTHFMPLVWQKDGELTEQVKRLVVMNPVAFEVIYQTEEQLATACEQAKNQGSRCWVNTLWESLSPGHSDDVSVLDPDAHWGKLTRLGVNMFQTDRPAALIKYLSSQGLRK